MSVCGKCDEELSSDAVFATCSVCCADYHLTTECSITEATWNAKSERKRKSWVCIPCRKDDKRQGVHQNRTSESTEEGTRIENKSLAKEIEELRSVIKTLQGSVNKWNSEAERREKEHRQTVKRLEETISKLVKGTEEREKYVEHLQERVCDLERNLYEKNIEIVGLAETIDNTSDEKKLRNKVVQCLKECQIDVKEDEIQEASLLENPRRRNNGATVIVKLKSKARKTELLKQFRQRRGRDGSGDIRLFEQLPKTQKALLWETRERARPIGWKFVCVQDGNILARKDEGQNIVRVRTMRDLEKIGD